MLVNTNDKHAVVFSQNIKVQLLLPVLMQNWFNSSVVKHYVSMDMPEALYGHTFYLVML